MQWVLRAGGYAAAIIGAACLLFLWVFRNFSEGAQGRILAALTFLPEASYKRIERTMAAFVQGLQSTRQHSVLWLVLFYTVLEWLVIVASYYTFFAHSAPLPDSLWSMFWSSLASFRSAALSRSRVSVGVFR